MDLYEAYDYDRQQNFPREGEILLYTVQRGDSPFRIARRFNTELNWVLCMNNLNRNSMIFPNQQLLIPVLFQKPTPLPTPQPQPRPPRPPMPTPPRPQPRSSLERNEFDMYF